MTRALSPYDSEWYQPDDGIIDEIAVERALRGERVPLSQPEKFFVYCELRRRGLLATLRQDHVLAINGNVLKKFQKRWESRMTGITPEEIVDRMAYHPATPEAAEKYDALRRAAIDFARLTVELVPGGREQSLMVTHIEEALMWGSKAIARTTPADTSDTSRVARVLPNAVGKEEVAAQAATKPAAGPGAQAVKCECGDVQLGPTEASYVEGGKLHRPKPAECARL